MQTTGERDMAGSTRLVTGRGNRAAVRGRLSRDGGRGLEVSRGKREGERQEPQDRRE
jgi:hypothetical protein